MEIWKGMWGVEEGVEAFEKGIVQIKGFQILKHWMG